MKIPAETLKHVSIKNDFRMKSNLADRDHKTLMIGRMSVGSTCTKKFGRQKVTEIKFGSTEKIVPNITNFLLAKYSSILN